MRRTLLFDVSLVALVWAAAVIASRAFARHVAFGMTVGFAVVTTWRLVSRAAGGEARLLPRPQPDRRYLELLWNRLRHPGAARAPRRAPTAGWRVLVLVVGIAVLLVDAFVAPQDAPSTAVLPLPAASSVVGSVAAGSDVDSGSDPSQYRYMAVAGDPGISTNQFLTAVVRLLRARGWSHEYSFTYTTGSNQPSVLPITAPNASVELDSPDGNVYTAIDAIRTAADVTQQPDGTPLEGDPAIARARMQKRPLLWIMLGNGTHT